jgi:DNA-binding response OmpR family regulator
VLVVDDADDLRGLVALVLRQSGRRVVEAATAAAALEAHALHAPDVLLVDVHLADSSGLDLVAAVRATEQGRRTRVVLMTATPVVDPTVVADLAVDDVLVKPLMIDQILAAAGADPSAPR